MKEQYCAFRNWLEALI